MNDRCRALPGVALLAIVVLAAAPAGTAVPPPSPTCKVFINAKTGNGDAWGDSYVDSLREALIKSSVVTLAGSEDDAGLEIGVVTAKAGPGATAVSRVVMFTLRMRLPTDIPAENEERKPSAHTVRIVVRGPYLAIYNSKPALLEGVAKAADVVTDHRMLAACAQLSAHVFTPPGPAK